MIKSKEIFRCGFKLPYIFLLFFGIARISGFSVILAVIKEIIGLKKNNAFSNECSALSGLFSFVAASFFASVKPEETKDYAVVIYESISKNYNQRIKLSELAKKYIFQINKLKDWSKNIPDIH